MNKINFNKKVGLIPKSDPEVNDTLELDFAALIKENIVEVQSEDGKQYILDHRGNIEIPNASIKGVLVRFSIKGERNYIGVVDPNNFKTLKVGEPLSIKITSCIPGSAGYAVKLDDMGKPEETIIETAPISKLTVLKFKGKPTESDDAEGFIKATQSDIDDVMAA